MMGRGAAAEPAAAGPAVSAPADALPETGAPAPDTGSSFSEVLQSEGSSPNPGDTMDAAPDSKTATLTGARKRGQGQDKDSSAADDATASTSPLASPAPWLLPLPVLVAPAEGAPRHDLPTSMEAAAAAETGAVIDAPRHDSRVSMEARSSADVASLSAVARSLRDGTGEQRGERPALPDNARDLTGEQRQQAIARPDTARILGSDPRDRASDAATQARGSATPALPELVADNARALSAAPASTRQTTRETLGGYAAVDSDGVGRTDPYMAAMGSTPTDVGSVSTASAAVAPPDDITHATSLMPGREAEARGVAGQAPGRAVTTPSPTMATGRTASPMVPPLLAGRAHMTLMQPNEFGSSTRTMNVQAGRVNMTPVQARRVPATPMPATHIAATLTAKTVVLDEARAMQWVEGARAVELAGMATAAGATGAMAKDVAPPSAAGAGEETTIGQTLVNARQGVRSVTTSERIVDGFGTAGADPRHGPSVAASEAGQARSAPAGTVSAQAAATLLPPPASRLPRYSAGASRYGAACASRRGHARADRGSDASTGWGIDASGRGARVRSRGAGGAFGRYDRCRATRTAGNRSDHGARARYHG